MSNQIEPTRQRARSERDKQERRQTILAAALALWEERPFAAFAMSDVAARSGLAKGTLYLYFETKEELFLALLEQLLGEWFAALEAALAGADSLDAAGAAALICDTIADRAALTRLLLIAASILEQNIPLERARAYKERLLGWSLHAGELLERRIGFLKPGDGVWLLLQVHALVVGLGQMAAPAAPVAVALAAEHLAPLRVELGPALRRSLETLLRGMERAADAG